MKWSSLTTEERNRLMHEKVMGKSVKCSGAAVTTMIRNPSRIPGQTAFEYPTWHCDTCEQGGPGVAPKEHDIPGGIPSYSSDMNAVMQVVRQMNSEIDQYGRFIEALEKVVGSDMFYDLFYCDQDGDHLNPDRICRAALSACGVETE